jgi:hypothetical protein
MMTHEQTSRNWPVMSLPHQTMCISSSTFSIHNHTQMTISRCWAQSCSHPNPTPALVRATQQVTIKTILPRLHFPPAHPGGSTRTRTSRRMFSRALRRTTIKNLLTHGTDNSKTGTVSQILTLARTILPRRRFPFLHTSHKRLMTLQTNSLKNSHDAPPLDALGENAPYGGATVLRGTEPFELGYKASSSRLFTIQDQAKKEKEQQKVTRNSYSVLVTRGHE